MSESPETRTHENPGHSITLRKIAGRKEPLPVKLWTELLKKFGKVSSHCNAIFEVYDGCYLFSSSYEVFLAHNFWLTRVY